MSLVPMDEGLNRADGLQAAKPRLTGKNLQL
jgi:hypothetical protein